MRFCHTSYKQYKKYLENYLLGVNYFYWIRKNRNDDAQENFLTNICKKYKNWLNKLFHRYLYFL